MKIGILTFHSAQNYGAVLQCYALQSLLSGMGHDVAVIDYNNDDIVSGYRIFQRKRYIGADVLSTFKKTIRELSLLPGRIGRKQAFEGFVSRKIKLISVEDIGTLDVIIIGSDQVWNYNLTGGFDEYYWGNIESKAKKYTYAASMQDNWPTEYNTKIRILLDNYSNVSVRENTLRAKLLSIGVKKDIKVVTDPTLLLSNIEWENVITHKIKTPCNYVFLYMAEISASSIALAKAFADIKKLPLIILTSGLSKYDSPCVRVASPDDFITLIRNASYVICSSFHATVFSIIFKKRFVTVSNSNGKNNRILSLLRELSLENRMISHEINSKLDVIDAEYDVNLSTLELVQDSKAYLNSICHG